MHPIRVQLHAPAGTPAGVVPPSPESLRDGLERGLGGPVRIEHARILTGPVAVDAVVFVLAGSLLTAESAVAAACTALTGPEGPLPGWLVSHCAADSWLALGLHELPTYR
ncbi:hypothetical protein [Streptomyces sp. CBMA156]|uniref:hypothetical protein n=1 Tax=Streptomyces sp. CBMA156 TaxID=1930280 RepID=UPI001661F37A|nr:hypothetical protein [Streptomyces sp. CBMA156]